MPRRERALDAEGDEVLVAFARDLRRLREQAGSPTYRELSARAHYSAAALSEAAGGRKLPSLAVTLAYVAACDGDVTAWEKRWREVAAEIADTARDAVDEEAPYVGLTAFQVGDADRFFGREELVADLLRRVREHRFLGVFGASGSGKSSVLRAGLAARLTRQGLPAVVLTPGVRPIEECAVHLAALDGTPPGQLRAELAADPRNLHLHVRKAMADRPADEDLLLVVDQFEEVFTLAEPTERAWLITALTTAASAENSRTRVVLGVRADFYGHCGRHPELVEALRDAQVLVGGMTSHELQRAITAPAVRAGLRVETALVSKLVGVSANEAGYLPLLSHVLLEVWRRRRGTTLTLAGYEASGGIRHAVTRTAEDTFAGLDPEQQRIAKQVFLRLVALGEGTEDTKRRIHRRELDDDDPNTDVVLDRLARARLITLDTGSVEIAHEALIRRWPRLRDWLTENRAGLRVHRELTASTEIWESLDRDPSALYRGARLAIADGWASTSDDALTKREREFLDASRSAQAHEHVATRRRTRRLRRLLALLTVLVVVAVSTTVLAIRTQQAASRQRDAALAQNVLREATAVRATNPALALQLALAAYRLDPGTAARNTLHEMMATPYAARLLGHTDTVFAVAVSPNGKVMATADRNDVRLWDITDPYRPRERAIVPYLDGSSLAFSPDGLYLAINGDSKTPELWDVADPNRPIRMAALGDYQTYDEAGTAVAFHPGGQLLATANSNRTIRLWNIADPQRPKLLATLPGGVAQRLGAAVAFSPDGRILAGTDADSRVRLWDIANPLHPDSLTTLPGHTGAVLGIAFHPSERLLATAGHDTTTRLWNVDNPEVPEALSILTGHTGAVFAVAFGPDGTTLATASADRTTRAWNVVDRRSPAEMAALAGHTGEVLAVAFAAGGRALATAGADRTARLEDIAQVVLAGHGQPVHGVEFSADGRFAVTISADRTVQLWEVADPLRPRRLGTIRGDLEPLAVSFRRDGRFIATTEGRGVVRLWDVSDPDRPRAAGSIPGAAGEVEFNPDGNILAVSGFLETRPRLWDVSDPYAPRALGDLAITDHINEFAFHPTGHVLATTQLFGTTRLWSVTDPRNPRLLGEVRVAGNAVRFGPGGEILAIMDRTGRTALWNVAIPEHPEELATHGGGTEIRGGATSPLTFSPDGRLLITAGREQTAQVWNVADPRHPNEIATLRGHKAQVRAVAMSPDGRTIATASEDHTVRLWETDVERLASRVCEVAWPRLTEAEWGQYFPGLENRLPCP